MTEQSRKELLDRTLSMINEPFANWKTYNDKMNSKLFIQKENTGLKLMENELPLFECEMSDSYLLISSDRIISKINDEQNEMLISEIVKFGDEFEKDNIKPLGQDQPKTNLISVYSHEGARLIYKVDSWHPAHFTRILIGNIIKIFANNK